MENNLQTILEDYNIPELGERNYWFVRTDSGTFFDDFLTNNYIAIGWDYLTLEKLQLTDGQLENPENLKKVISLAENRPIEVTIDNSDEPDYEQYLKKIVANKTEVTKILNKVVTFVHEICTNDIVIIPSVSSNKIAIGCVTSDVYEDPNYIDKFVSSFSMPEYELCTFSKRRNMKWYKTINKDNLEIYLQNALKPQQAISSLNDYATFIDRNIYDFYFKENAVHSIVRTNQTGDMSLGDLKKLIDLFYDISTNPDFNSAGDLCPDDIKVKLNIHSPGIIELIYCGFGAIMLGILFFGTYTVHKNGGKIKFKTKDGTEFIAETKGTAGNSIEQQKLKLIESCLNSPDYKDKIEALSSLNLNVPDVYPVYPKIIGADEETDS